MGLLALLEGLPMSRRSRDKGARGERELAELLTAAGFPATRGRQYRGGSDSPDVLCAALPRFYFEVKRTERLNLYQAMAQAQAESSGKTPVVAHRRNGREWLAVLRLEDFLALLRNRNETERAA